MIFVNSGTIQELSNLDKGANCKMLVKPEDIQNGDQISINRFILLSQSFKGEGTKGF